MFNLPFGTAAYGLPTPQTVMEDGKVVPQEFFSYLAVITAKVQDLDEAYISRRPETELVEKVFRTDQELRSLSNLTPQNWWNLTSDSPLPDHVLQYWYYYFTVRAHLQLALRQGSDSQHMYSYLTCYQASRAVAQRYVKLRGLLPPGFFAGRVLDLQALTGAAVLLFTSQRQPTKQGVSVQDENGLPSSQLVHEVIQMMDTVAGHTTGSFAKQAAPSLRALNDLLNKPGQSSSKDLTLHIPMLGKINVSQHAKPAQMAQAHPGPGQDISNGTSYGLSWQAPVSGSQAPDITTSGMTSDDMLWSSKQINGQDPTNVCYIC
jgi:hypothetical protein